MAIDLYETCPCGSGKKIKFCCPREAQADFVKAWELLGTSHQRAAAVERCDRGLAKAPGQSCLLTVKLMAQLELGELDEAQKTWEQLHQSAPESPVTHAFRVFFALMGGEIESAVGYLQDSLEHVPREVPWNVRSALERTMVALLDSGNVFAFIQYAHNYDKTGIEEPDQQILGILKKLCLNPSVPPTFKQPWFDRLLGQYPEPFRKSDLYVDWNLFRWRKLRARFAEWHAQGQHEPCATVYLALMHALLLEEKKAGALLREFARRPDAPDHLAAEALLLAHGLDPFGDPAETPRIHLEYTVSDVEPLMERLLSDRRVRSSQIDPRQFAQAGEPPPRGIFDVHDRPVISDWTQPVSEFPIVIATAYLYGRQTDREPRFEVILFEDAGKDNVAVLNDIIQPFIQGEPRREAIESISRQDQVGPRIAAPQLERPQEIEQFKNNYIEYTLREYWPNQPHPFLGGKTPKEAVGDATLRRGLLAALVHLETQPDFDVWSGDYRAYWQQFGMEHELKELSSRFPPMVWLTLLNPEQLDDDALWSACVYAAAMGIRRACNELGRAVLNRPTLCEREELGELLSVLINATSPIEVRLEILEGAIAWCERKEVSAGRFLVQRFVCHALLNQTEQATSTLQLLSTKYRHEQNTMMMLFETLQALGMIGPDGRPVEPGAIPGAAAEPAPAASGLWTPDQAAAAPAGEKSGKLWLPGMD